MKRGVDLFFSFAGLVLLFPFFLILAVAVKAGSTGPVFYRQERVGRNGVPFQLFKFRTMILGADRSAAITVGKRDSRITRVGFFLRKFKLDELPQLFNVLIGDMSLVGPRPELKQFTDLYNEEQRKVLILRPGITDFASIRFRNENELLEGKSEPISFYVKEIMPAKLSLNLKYMAKQNLWVDFKIIFQTLISIFKKS
jgi:lipopolysaccharide/colanic/teichoic acid biosynthesis glycosyltransferase